MLYYSEVQLSHAEVPGENSLCIYLTGCQNRCPNCHYPELQYDKYGDPLILHYKDIIDLYSSQATCVCFMGEGAGTIAEHAELIVYAEYAHSLGLASALYSGRDTAIEDWMHTFTYIKLGSYQEIFGPLDSAKTNQRMYKKEASGSYGDVTPLFWDKGAVSIADT